VTGDQTCVLECADGFIKAAGGELRCAANNNEAMGILLGDIDCTGIRI